MLSNAEYLEKALIPVFRNFIFSSYDAFRVPILDKKEDSEYFSVIFLHGCLYRQICFVLGEQLNGERYQFYYNNHVSERFENDCRIFSFQGTDFVRVEFYPQGEQFETLIYPLLATCIEADVKQKNKS